MASEIYERLRRAEAAAAANGYEADAPTGPTGPSEGATGPGATGAGATGAGAGSGGNLKFLFNVLKSLPGLYINSVLGEASNIIDAVKAHSPEEAAKIYIDYKLRGGRGRNRARDAALLDKIKEQLKRAGVPLSPRQEEEFNKGLDRASRATTPSPVPRDSSSENAEHLAENTPESESSDQAPTGPTPRPEAGPAAPGPAPAPMSPGPSTPSDVIPAEDTTSWKSKSKSRRQPQPQYASKTLEQTLAAQTKTLEAILKTLQALPKELGKVLKDEYSETAADGLNNPPPTATPTEESASEPAEPAERRRGGERSSGRAMIAAMLLKKFGPRGLQIMKKLPLLKRAVPFLETALGMEAAGGAAAAGAAEAGAASAGLFSTAALGSKVAATGISAGIAAVPLALGGYYGSTKADQYFNLPEGQEATSDQKMAAGKGFLGSFWKGEEAQKNQAQAFGWRDDIKKFDAKLYKTLDQDGWFGGTFANPDMEAFKIRAKELARQGKVLPGYDYDPTTDTLMKRSDYVPGASLGTPGSGFNANAAAALNQPTSASSNNTNITNNIVTDNSVVQQGAPNTGNKLSVRDNNMSPFQAYQLGSQVPAYSN